MLKRHRALWVIIPAVAAGVAIVGGALYIEYVTSIFGKCKTVVRDSIPSPDRRKPIVIFEKECGATVPFNTQASIASAGGSFRLRITRLSLLFPVNTSLRPDGWETAPLKLLVLFQERVKSQKANKVSVI